MKNQPNKATVKDGLPTAKDRVQEQAESIYHEILCVAKEHGTDYVRTWWLNPRNGRSGLSTPTINRRCELLVRQGKLIRLDASNSTGTGYKIIR